MCNKAGFNVVHRGSKSAKQLSAQVDTFVILCCQHGIMYINQKTKDIRKPTIKWCLKSTEKCPFRINTALTKFTQRWMSSQSSRNESNNDLQHLGHIHLEPHNRTATPSMIQEKHLQLMSPCS